MPTGVEIGVIAGTAVTVGDAMLVAGTLAAAAGAISQGRQQDKISRHNARMAERQAQEAEQAGQIEAERARRKARRLRSSQLAAAGAQGVDATQGSALLLIAETQSNAEIDALNIERAGSVQAVNARAQAAADRYAGSAYRTAGYTSAASTLLGGAAKAGERFERRKADAEAA